MRSRTEILLLLKRGLGFFALWLVLTGGRADGIVFGLAAAALAALASRRLAPPAERRLRPLRLALLAPRFLARSLAGGMDVARRAFHPRLPLRPGWIRYRASLPGGAPRVLLGSEISLLPGTLVAGEADGCLLVHCLDTDLPALRQIEEEEARLGRAIADD
jgi:multicomponent Na+:H+ antiporter subunit E